MNKLAGIPVRIETTRPQPENEGGLGGGVAALLQEIAVLLDRLQESGEPGAVDLRSMPMAAGDRERLRDVLGNGEVEAVVESDGVTWIRETATHGVWWIEHYGGDEEMVAEMIEVTLIPAILPSQKEDLPVGADRLRRRLAAKTESGELNKQGTAYGNIS